ncbi:MAG: succinate--CoA ligase subunit alpha [Treponema sp.]|jgi:succinyl-CoA synthetase alpha subunit|nr:succinate--CoA ligase subunit alpha [Treponema sp.]
MSIIIDENTRLLVQGITGREGSFHTRTMLEYGTKVVGGVTPGKGGQEVFFDVKGKKTAVPVFNTVREAAEKTRCNATVLFVPAKFTPAGVYEAIDAGIPVIMTISEHTPVHEMMKCYYAARQRGLRLFGPNSFGIISPGKCKAGFMAHRYYTPGPVGIMSRSATNCYETVMMMTARGIGQSTCIGIGGDMIPGSAFVDLLPDFQADGETKAVVLIGEIGGSEEEIAAEYIKGHVTKPVVALIAGKNAPKGKNMGHAGAIVGSGGEGGAENKEKALSAAGVHIAESTGHIVEILRGLKL